MGGETKVSSTENFHKNLVDAIHRDEIRLGVSIHRANSPGSIGFSYFDTISPIFLLVAISIYVFYKFGIIFGLVQIAFSIPFYFIVVGRWIVGRATERVRVACLRDPMMFLDAWRAGWISLQHLESGDGAMSPGDKWTEFVVKHVLRKSPGSGNLNSGTS
jgi:hypothetical protein